MRSCSTRPRRHFTPPPAPTSLLSARNHAVEVAQKTRDDAQTRLDAGVVNRVELMRAQLALDRAAQAARESSDSRDQAYRALATVLQLRTPFHLVTERAPLSTDAHGDALVEMAPSGGARRWWQPI